MKKQLNKYKKLFINKPKTIDVFSLLLILFVISLTYLLFNRKVEYLDLTIRLLNYDIPEYTFNGNKPRPWYVEQIIPGKKQKDGVGRTLIEIVDIYSYPGPSVYYDSYVTLRIRATQNRITKQYIYNGSPLLIHDFRSFKIQDLLLNGEIIDMLTRDRSISKFEVVLELVGPQGSFDNNSSVIVDGVSNYIADSLKEKMVIQDSNDQDLVVVKEIKTQPGRRTIVDVNGYSSIVDPERTRVTLVLEIVGEKINDHYYYRKEAPLILGNHLHLMFDQVAVYGPITSLKLVSD